MDGPSSAREESYIEKVGDDLHFHFLDTDGTVPCLLLKVPEQFALDHPHLLGRIMWDIYQLLKCPSLLDEAIKATQIAAANNPELAEDASLFFDLGSRLVARFKLKNDLNDVYRARDAFQRAAVLTRDGDPEQAKRLFQAGTLGLMCFTLTGWVDVLNDAITALCCTIDLLSEGDQNMLSALYNYSEALLGRFRCLGNIDDLEKRLAVLLRALELAPDSHPYRPEWISNLGHSLWLRFQRVGELDDLEQSNVAFRRAVELTPDGCSGAPRRMSYLGSSLLVRFLRIRKLVDLEQSIAAFRRAVELTPDGHSDVPALISILGHSLRLRFERIGQLDDLEQMIVAFRRAVELTPESYSGVSERISNLGRSLLMRFQRSGKLDDLEQTITAFHRAVKLTPDGHPHFPELISTLGHSLQLRFGRTGQLDDLEQSVSAARRAVELMPDGHLSFPVISNHGRSLWFRFQRIGKLDDLEQSIIALHRAVELISDGHPHLPGWITNLGLSFQSRFQRIGQLGDLEQSIAAFRRAVSLSTPYDSPNLPKWIGNLGISLGLLFKRTGQLDNLEKCIAACRRAVELTPDGHPDLPKRIGNLGNSLCLRFERLGQLDDLEQSIAAFRSAVSLSTPDDSPKLPVWISNLGITLGLRFERIGQLDDLEQSIAAHRRAIELTPDGHPDLPKWNHNLGGSLRSRFKRMGQLDDLEQSIASLNEAIDLTFDNPAMQSSLYDNLGKSLLSLFQHNPTQSHFDAAVAAFIDSTQKSIGRPTDRAHTARLCFLMHLAYPAFSSKKSSLEAGSRLMAFLPEIAWLGHDVNRRFDEAAALAQHVYFAVSAAVETASLKQAVEWLEAGRAIIWSQVLSLRTPVNELQKQHPDLAETLRGLQHELRHSARVSSFASYAEPFGHVPGLSINTKADRHRQLADNYDSTLKLIRRCTGFEDFLCPKQLEKLVPSADLLCGPAIFLNVDSTHCDAIILSPGGGLTSLLLPELSSERALLLRRLWVAHVLSHRAGERATSLIGDQNAAATYLGHIWNWIVHPVLEALNFGTRLGPDDDLPHVTWCPTGPLMQLPLHAAGLYDKPDGPRVYDFVVSSYTPSLSTLSRCCEGVAEPCAKPGVLIVSQPATPNHAKLPGTVREAGRLENTLKSSGTTTKWLNDKAATMQEVRSVMGQYHWVHLACHGSQNREDPTQSAFELFDGPLTLSDLMGTVAENAEFAFLSACQTAVGDEKTPEESAHLAAGMLAAGYKGVVATMWSIQDADAPVVVDAFYEELLALRNAEVVKRGETGAAYALHKATRILREKIAENENAENEFMRWIPFVHFGV
ncbi:hypothetical protein PENSPDRAFT_657099 [Peniophora sp. CONT]|nr:hypothetical protein PENSPDRAFT_657099 [Peniophora sp. CONT]